LIKARAVAVLWMSIRALLCCVYISNLKDMLLSGGLSPGLHIEATS
jgi:hypothetical protein